MFFFPQGDPGAIGKYGPVGFAGDRVSYLSVYLPLLCFLVVHMPESVQIILPITQIKTEQVRTIHILPQLVSRKEDEHA